MGTVLPPAGVLSDPLGTVAYAPQEEIMQFFQYLDGRLACEGVSLAHVAQEYGTPAFVYSGRAFAEHYQAIARAFAALNPKICFSIKSCHNLHVLRLLREQGAAFDAVSGGEVRRAMEAGARPEDIVFAGAGKTETEIHDAIDVGVGWFNAESETELEIIAHSAERAGKVSRAAVRVNPDVDPHTHPYTTTGKSENKFGIEVDRARALFARYRRHRWLKLCGVHLHIGSPVNTVEPYVEAVTKALALIDQLRADGVEIESINLGGGYGASYEGDEAPPAADYARALVPLLEGRGLAVHLEPGRSISANAAVLLAGVICVKQSRTRRFVIVDAAMTDLLRPALYGAYHFIWPVEPADGLVPPHQGRDLKLPGTILVDVVGPVCESSDFLGKDRHLPLLKRGDLLATFSAGAYGAVMSSQYNSRPRAAEVLVEGGSARLIRRRETYDDLVAAEREV